MQTTRIRYGNMKQTDMNQLLDMVTEQRNKAEAERNALIAEMSHRTLEIIALRVQVEELEQEVINLKEGL